MIGQRGPHFRQLELALAFGGNWLPSFEGAPLVHFRTIPTERTYRRVFGHGLGVDLENNSKEWENIGVRELKRLGWGMREDGGSIGLAYFRVHLLITSPADFDNLSGTMRLNGSSDADIFAFPMSAASSEIRPNPTPIGTSGKVRQYQLAPLPNSGDRLWVPNAFFSRSGFIRPTRT